MRRLFFILAILSIYGCTYSVKIVSPEKDSEQNLPVRFELKFHEKADLSSWKAELNGINITRFFNFNGLTARAISSATGFPTLNPNSTYTFYAHAYLTDRRSYGGNDSEVTFRIAPLPVLVPNPSNLSVDIGATKNITINIPNRTPQAFNATIQPSNNRIFVSRSNVHVPQNSSSFNFSVQGITPGNSAVTVSAPGYQTANISVTVPTPGINVSISPNQTSIIWGQTTNLTVTVTSNHGFSGSVSLALENIPSGVNHSFSLSTINIQPNGSATSVLNLTSAVSNTQLDPPPLRVRATPQSGAISRTISFPLKVLRTPGSFISVTLTTGNSSCGSVSANVRSTGNGLGVEFTGSPFGRTRPNAVVEFFRNPGHSEPQGYAISSQCRIGVVRAPISNLNEHFTSFWNLGFNPSIGAEGLGNMAVQPVKGPYVQAFFSQDNSLCLLITAADQSLTNHTTAAGLLDFGRGSVISPSRFFTGFINSINLNVNTVTLNYTDPQNRPQSFTWQIP